MLNEFQKNDFEIVQSEAKTNKNKEDDTKLQCSHSDKCHMWTLEHY